jgi:hypothetical protein
MRMEHTIEAISEWLKIDPSIQLVICDGSGFDYTDTVKIKFPSAKIECISFFNDAEQVKIHGKGYGEGEIIRYALEHSQVLNESDVFMKCTAKLWLTNLNACLAQWNGRFVCGAYFADVFSLKKTKLMFVDTRFYISRKEAYKRFFLNAHKDLGNTPGWSIEDEFLKIIQWEQLKGIFFAAPPIISGVGGGSGRYYRNGMVRVLKDRLRAYIASRYSRYTDLFIGG